MSTHQIPFHRPTAQLEPNQKRPTSPLKPHPPIYKKSQLLYAHPQQFKPRLNVSPLSRQERDVSPTTSAVSSKQQEFMQQMEWSLLNQNRNLQDHNTFLVNQIKQLFKRQKAYVRALRKSKKANQELMEMNRQLQLQLESITQQTLLEIERIQNMLKNQRAMLVEELLVSSQSSDPKSEALGWQTESTINHNLEQLKNKMHSFVRQPTFRYSFEFQKDLENKDNPNCQSPVRKNKFNTDSKVTDSSAFNPKSEEQFTEYLPPRPPSLYNGDIPLRKSNHRK